MSPDASRTKRGVWSANVEVRREFLLLFLRTLVFAVLGFGFPLKASPKVASSRYLAFGWEFWSGEQASAKDEERGAE